MDARRPNRTVPYPIVRQVGFFAPEPDRTGPGPFESTSPPSADVAPITKSLSPVMIRPTRHNAENLISVPVAVPVPSVARRRNWSKESVRVGSYNPSESLLGTSPATSSQVEDDDRDGDEFSEESSSIGWFRRGVEEKFAAPSSLLDGGLDSVVAKSDNRAVVENRSSVLVAKKPDVVLNTGPGRTENAVAEVQNKFSSSSIPSKEKMSKAERRALQESQRAAKAAAKGNGSKSAVLLGVVVPGKTVTDAEKKGGDSIPDKDKKKDVLPPRMQFDDKSRVEKAKRRDVVKKTEAKNRVELFRHLPQYEHGTQILDLESKFFQLDSVHPAIHKVGLKFLSGDIFGGNARCVAMLRAFQEAIKDYCTPPEKTLVRDLTARINSYISFLIECRPLSISMGNAIRFLKNRIAKLSITKSESEAKDALCSDIEHFITEKIVLAGNAIVKHAMTKIRDGDVLLTYGSSCVVEMIFLQAHKLGKQFRVVIVDSRPKLEGQALLRRLVEKGITCTYTQINAVSYIMHEVTRVFLGAASIFSNGTVFSRVGTASVAMVAHTFRVPVLVCCEAYKFHERVQLDSICSNELGDPDAISKVPGRPEVHYLDNWADKENLQLLNLIYDVTPSEYVSMIITDYGMVPPTSVAVIVRDYGPEHLWA